MKKDDSKYRLCVGIMLLNKENKVFVGMRADSLIDAWQMPQGGVDEGENLASAAYRELYEETSIKNVKLIKESNKYFYYDLPDNIRSKVWGGKYLGQRQKWFLMAFKGEEEEININSSHPEFTCYQWIERQNLVKHIVPFKKEVYQNIVDEFADYSYE